MELLEIPVLDRTAAIKTVKNTTWIIMGKLAVFGLSFAFFTALANLLPASSVGIYNYVTSVLAILSILTLQGMGTALVRAVARGYEGSLTKMSNLRLLWGSAATLVSVVIGTIYLIHGNSTLGWIFILAAPFIPLTDTYSYMALGFFQGKKQFRKSVAMEILCQALFSIPTIVVIFFTHNLIIITVSLLIFQTIGGFIVYRQAKPSDGRTDEASVRFGFHLTVQSAPRMIAMNVDTIIVFAFAGPVAAAVYTIAFTPMSKVEQLIPIDTLALPDLSNQPITADLKKKLWNRTFFLVLLIIPVIAAGWVLAPLGFHILFPKFPQSIFLFRLLLITLLTTPFVLLKTSFVAWGKKRELYINEIFSPMLRIVLMAILGFRFGALGVVIGILIARFAETAVIGSLFSRLSE